jgi:hypothetical protein
MLSKNFAYTGQRLYVDQIRSPTRAAPHSATAAIETERVEVVGMKLQPSPGLQERSRHPTWGDPQQPSGAGEFAIDDARDTLLPRDEFEGRGGWRDHRGSIAESKAASIPEPTCSAVEGFRERVELRP